RSQPCGLGLEACGNRLAGWTLTREQTAELVHARAIRLDEMVHDLLDRPLAGNACARSLGGRHPGKDLIERGEGRRHTLVDGRRRDARSAVAEVLTRLLLRLVGDCRVHDDLLSAPIVISCRFSARDSG